MWLCLLLQTILRVNGCAGGHFAGKRALRARPRGQFWEAGSQPCSRRLRSWLRKISTWCPSRCNCRWPGCCVAGSSPVTVAAGCLRPVLAQRAATDLLFDPDQLAGEQRQAALGGRRLLPTPFPVQGRQRGDGLRKPAQVGDKRDGKVSQRPPPGPAFGQQPVQGLFGIVMGQSGGPARVGQRPPGAVAARRRIAPKTG